MSTLLYGMVRDSTPAEINTVRSTTATVENDAPAAELDGAPDYNELQTDDNPHLGMESRQLAGDWHDRVRYARTAQDIGKATTDFNKSVNDQVATSGTAAGRESRGQWGHGDFMYSVAIEPVNDLREGGAMGNEYFKAPVRPVQDGTDYSSMRLPPGTDREAVIAAAATGKSVARDAYAGSLYAAWHMGGGAL